MKDTVVLANLLRNAILYGDDQRLINMYAEELAKELATDEESYSRLLTEYGYKNLEKEEGKVR